MLAFPAQGGVVDFGVVAFVEGEGKETDVGDGERTGKGDSGRAGAGREAEDRFFVDH